MELVIVSDSHGRNETLDYVLQQHPNAYAYIHCGDIDTDPGSYPQFVTVGGNNDIFYDYPDEQILNVGTHRIYITHSHLFMYSHRAEQMAQTAKRLSCDIVCYGHTHVAADETVDGIRLINPGSLWRSRDGRGPSYALINIEGDQVDVKFQFLPQKQKKNRFFW